jgi:hypothetical protein
MSQRQAVTRAKAQAYARADRANKTQLLDEVLDELVEQTGWHRDWVRAALRDALRLNVVRPRAPRAPTYGPGVITAQVTRRAVAPMLPVLVPM